MDEETFMNIVRDALFLYAYDEEVAQIGIKRVRTFKEIGMLTNDNGVEVELNNGSKFHVVIKKVG